MQCLPEMDILILEIIMMLLTPESLWTNTITQCKMTTHIHKNPSNSYFQALSNKLIGRHTHILVLFFPLLSFFCPCTEFG